MSVDHRMNTIIYYRIDYKVLLVLLVFMYIVHVHCIITNAQCIVEHALHLFTPYSTNYNEYVCYNTRNREIENLRRQIDILNSGIGREEEKAYELEIKAK